MFIDFNKKLSGNEVGYMLEVKLHDIGEGMTEGEIVSYLVKVGDQVTSDQPLVEVQTDKMVAELPSPSTGIVKDIVVEPGVTVEVGTTLLYIEADQTEKVEPLDHTVPVQSAVKEKTQPHIQQHTTALHALAAPYTRKLARDRNMNIEVIQGTGPDGRVTDADVLQFAAQQEQPAVNTTFSLQRSEPQNEVLDEIPYRGIRRQIAKKMTKSLFTIPHVTHFDEVDMTNLLSLRQALKDSGQRITVAAFLVKALVFALKDFPIFNAELDEENERIRLKKQYHIGMATDTDNGLLVPVIKHVDKKTIGQIHDEVKHLTEAARANRLKPAEMKNSTFTVSNVGPLGSTAATPIINYPETALIAFHKTKKTPVVNERDEIVIRQIMTLSMSFDHRVADGATAVAFTNRFAEFIEQPGKLLLEMT